jgi:hypothetical protein
MFLIDKDRFQGNAPIAALLEGPFPFIYEGEPVPKWPEPEAGEDAETPEEEEATEEEETASIKPGTGRALIVTGGDMLHINYLQDAANQGNLNFLFNTVEASALGEDLIHIRAKAFVDRPLKEGNWTFYKALNLVLAPLLVIAFGFIRIFVRRRAKAAYLSAMGRGN